MLNRMPTLDRMISWGLGVDGNCKLCQNGMESRDHLFFECSYSKEVWQSVLQLCGLTRRILRWEEEIEWASQKFKGKSLISNILRLAWNASIYHNWKERNGRMHGQTSAAPNQIVQHIQDDIRLRLISLKSITNDAVNCLLCHNWGLSLISSVCL